MTGRVSAPSRTSLSVAGLFAGIGGIELGLQRSGHTSEVLCELELGASRVLRTQFPDVPYITDVRSIQSLPSVSVLTAGFPCQDLSQAGRTAGIAGKQSSLVEHVFRLIDSKRRGPRWLMLENVPFMLQLDRGRAMRYLVDELEARNFFWAYRVVDARAFGLPQRRQRVILIASRSEDPKQVLFADDASPSNPNFSKDRWCGFYWTEGVRGLGWAVDAVPTLKGGSTIGIASPPAIWIPRTGLIGTPDVRDAERLQGFDVDWTAPALDGDSVRPGHRWKLIGNAVSVPVAEWVGARLAAPGSFDEARVGELLEPGTPWPRAAFGLKGRVYRVDVSTWPVHVPSLPLSQFLKYPLKPLSARAAAGFYSRADSSRLRFQDGFLDDIRRHASRMARSAVA